MRGSCFGPGGQENLRDCHRAKLGRITKLMLLGYAMRCLPCSIATYRMVKFKDSEFVVSIDIMASPY
jgi:hypothetical protein